MLSYPEGQTEGQWLIDRLFFRGDGSSGKPISRASSRRCAGFSNASALAALSSPPSNAPSSVAQKCRCTCAVMADGRFERQQAASQGASKNVAPDVLAADEPLAVALRAGRAVDNYDDMHSSVPGQLAIVLSAPDRLRRDRTRARWRYPARRRGGGIARAALQSVGVGGGITLEALQRKRAVA